MITSAVLSLVCFAIGFFLALLIASFLRSAAIAAYYYCGGWKRAVQKFEQSRAV